MSLIAIIAHDRRGLVERAEVDELAKTFVSLRGGEIARRASAGDHGHAIEIGSQAANDAEATSGDSSWALVTGIVHGEVSPGKASVEDLEGQFALIAHDAGAGEITIATDPFGMLGLYVAERDGKTYVATSALALAKHLRAKPTRRGLETFLLTGYHFGALTNFEGIKRLDPGTRIVFTEQGARTETYWAPQVDRAVAKMGLADAVRHCADVAQATYAPLLGGDGFPWADVTGGFDTRLLLLMLDKAGARFRTNTVGDDDNPEVQIGRRLAAAAGWEWHQLKLPADWGEVIPSILPTSVAWSDGHLDVLQLSQVLWGHQEKTRMAAGSLMIGGGGEHFRSFAWMHEILKAGRTTEVNVENWVALRCMPSLDKSVFVRDPTAEVKADLGERMRARAAPYSSELNTTQLDVMYAYKVTGHFGSYLSAARSFIDGQLPFYFRPVFSAAFSTSYRHRNYHRLARHLIGALDPRIAALPTTNGGPAEPYRATNLYRFVPYYVGLGRRGLNKLSHKLRGNPLFRVSSGPDMRIVDARRAVIEQLAGDGGLVPGNMRTGRLYRPAELDDLLQRAMRPDFEEDRLLGRIVTLELVLRAADASLDE